MSLFFPHSVDAQQTCGRFEELKVEHWQPHRVQDKTHHEACPNIKASCTAMKCGSAPHQKGGILLPARVVIFFEKCLHFGPFRVRFGRFLANLGVMGGVGVGSGRVGFCKAKEYHYTERGTHPNKSTVCTNDFGTVCTIVPSFPFKISKALTERVGTLVAQQRYFSYCAMLVAMLSQNCFVLVSMGVSRGYRAICCKMGVSHRRACATPSSEGGGGYHTILREC